LAAAVTILPNSSSEILFIFIGCSMMLGLILGNDFLDRCGGRERRWVPEVILAVQNLADHAFSRRTARSRAERACSSGLISRCSGEKDRNTRRLWHSWVAATYGRNNGDLCIGGYGGCQSACVAGIFLADKQVDVIPNLALFGYDAIANAGI
jgi:hypothetical protein